MREAGFLAERSVKKGVIGLAVFAALIVAAMIAARTLIDTDDYRHALAGALADASGRDVRVGGAVEITLFPTLGLSARDVSIANLSGAGVPDMVHLVALEMRIGYLPLLSGRVRVRKIVLVKPEIHLEVLPDGRRNWDFGTPDSAAENTDRAAAIALEDLVIEDGSIDYRNDAAGRRLALVHFEGQVRAESLKGPFTGSGGFEVDDIRYGIKGTLGRIERQKPVAVSLSLTLPAARAVVNAAGTLKTFSPEELWKGTLKASAPGLGALVAAWPGPGLPAPRLGAPAFSRAVELSARAVVGETAARFEDIDIQLGAGDAKSASSLRGNLGFDLSSAPVFSGKLVVNRLRVEDFEPPNPAPNSPVSSDKGDGKATPSPVASGDDKGGWGDYRGSLDISVGALNYRDAAVRQLAMRLRLEDGFLSLPMATALLPGGSDFSLSGRTTRDSEGPRFDGRLRAASSNLRALLDWLGRNPEDIPADRLTKLTLDGRLTLRPGKLVQLYDLEIGLDTATITGGIAYALQDRLSFSADLVVDRFNLDGYRALKVPPGSGKADKGKNKKNKKPAGQKNNRPDLSFLGKFDTRFKLAVGRMTVNGVDLSGITVNAGLIDGVLKPGLLAFKGDGGIEARLEGSARDIATEPDVAMTLRLAAADIGALGRLAGDDATLPATLAGAVALDLTVTGPLLTKPHIAGELALGGSRLRLEGTISQPTGKPAVDLTVNGGNDSLAALAGQFGLAEYLPSASGGQAPVTASGAVAGDAGGLDVDLDLGVAGGSLGLSGRISVDAKSPTFDVLAQGQHADLLGLMRNLGLDYKPAGKQLGAVTLAARLTGDSSGYRARDIAATIGPANITGEADWPVGKAGQDGKPGQTARPRLALSLAGGAVDVDPYLAEAAAGTAAVRRSGAGFRWSGRPLRSDWLSRFDGTVDFAASSLKYGPYRLDKPRFTLVLDHGQLSLNKMTAGLFGGGLTASGGLEARAVSALALNFDLTGASVEQLLAATADVRPATGRVDIKGAFTAHGDSQRAMIATLAGTATVDARNGVLQGIDLKGFSDGLGGLKSIAEFPRHVARSFNNGQTVYRRLAGRLVARDGIVRNRDMVIDIDAANAEMALTVDLPAWRLMSKNRFRLKDHPRAPEVGLDLDGPLNAPKKRYATRALRTFIARRLGAALLRRAIGKTEGGVDALFDDAFGIGKEDPAPAADDSQPASPPPDTEKPPEDPAAALLQGLLGKLKKKAPKDQKAPPDNRP